jgi:23S rRNA (cytidine1920-2'-O)/16S rRNA (cytidine1409-2'-O)-methyltransferase
VGAGDRLDRAVMRRGWFLSRTRAQAAIRGGLVWVDGRPARDPSRRVDEASSAIELTGDPFERAGRGAMKLEAALDRWAVSAQGWRVADIGASTGGFTETWLLRGARQVYAVDVGSGQLQPWLRDDPRVVVRDRVNARTLTPESLAGSGRDVPEALDAASIDVSFIGLHHVLGPTARLVRCDGVVLALLKPQFEVGRDGVGKGGVVRDREAVGAVLRRYRDAAAHFEVVVEDVMRCPVPGRDGNQEFWLKLARTGRAARAVSDEVLAAAVDEAYGVRAGGQR